MPLKYPLSETELWWVNHQIWLQSCGYLLRPRFRVGWVQSTIEEETMTRTSWVMDATRITDGAIVALKRVRRKASQEERIMRLLNSEALVAHPDNPCAPLYGVLSVPDEVDFEIFVIPFLRTFDSPPFETVGEIMDFCRQALYGLRFLHENDIAHRDPHYMNIMLDPTNMYPHGFYPGKPYHDDLKHDFSGKAKAFTRTQRPSRYFWIDYGLSGTYDRSDRPGLLLVPYVMGGNKDIPETKQKRKHADPFAADVWWMGDLIQKKLITSYSGLEFLKPLVVNMCQENPEDRPSMTAAAAQFDAILAQCSACRLRGLTVRRKDQLVHFLRAFPAYILHTLAYLLMQVPALPSSREHHDDRRT
ncbi:hypothetical protein B0H11DRAFT_753413 [Mycena galericulata]|nr:hypothetical protein B0H11DRAFT_753413 [Mycena galericulata]